MKPHFISAIEMEREQNLYISLVFLIQHLVFYLYISLVFISIYCVYLVFDISSLLDKIIPRNI